MIWLLIKMFQALTIPSIAKGWDISLSCTMFWVPKAAASYLVETTYLFLPLSILMDLSYHIVRPYQQKTSNSFSIVYRYDNTYSKQFQSILHNSKVTSSYLNVFHRNRCMAAATALTRDWRKDSVARQRLVSVVTVTYFTTPSYGGC